MMRCSRFDGVGFVRAEGCVGGGLSAPGGDGGGVRIVSSTDATDAVPRSDRAAAIRRSSIDLPRRTNLGGVAGNGTVCSPLDADAW
eukprot:1560117-Prymnesium_polylepis.2